MLLKEEIYLNTETGQTASGKDYQIVYVDPDKSESTYDIKDKLKEYGMVYFPGNNVPLSITTKNDLKRRKITWGWLIWGGESDPAWSAIKKFQQEVGSFEKPNGTSPRTEEEINGSLPETIQEILKDVKEAKVNLKNSAVNSETKQRIAEFEAMIANGLDDVKTQEFLEAAIKYRAELRKHNTYNLSWTNVILALLTTNGEATEIRSLGEWEKMGYEPKEGARKIGLIGKGTKVHRYTKQEKERIIQSYLQKKGVESVDELPPSSQYDLFNRRLKGSPIPGTEYAYNYIAYDVSDMVPKEGAEVEPEEPDNWWWDKSDETEKDIALTTALIKFAESEECGNITVLTANSAMALDGARGVASNKGTITIINDGKLRFPTLVHELLHQLRHWAFASNNNPRLAKFYDRNSMRETREQEAELCAAFVTSQYGYDVQSHLNYLKSWGLTKQNCKAVFDKISEIASFIERGIESHLEENN